MCISLVNFISPFNGDLKTLKKELNVPISFYACMRNARNWWFNIRYLIRKTLENWKKSDRAIEILHIEKCETSIFTLVKYLEISSPKSTSRESSRTGNDMQSIGCDACMYTMHRNVVPETLIMQRSLETVHLSLPFFPFLCFHHKVWYSKIQPEFIANSSIHFHYFKIQKICAFPSLSPSLIPSHHYSLSHIAIIIQGDFAQKRKANVPFSPIHGWWESRELRDCMQDRQTHWASCLFCYVYMYIYVYVIMKLSWFWLTEVVSRFRGRKRRRIRLTWVLIRETRAEAARPWRRDRVMLWPRSEAMVQRWWPRRLAGKFFPRMKTT